MGVDIVARNEALNAIWVYIDQNLPYNIEANMIDLLLGDLWFACEGGPGCTVALACDYLCKWKKPRFSFFLRFSSLSL